MRHPLDVARRAQIAPDFPPASQRARAERHDPTAAASMAYLGPQAPLGYP